VSSDSPIARTALVQTGPHRCRFSGR